jgi:hypothetical protein
MLACLTMPRKNKVESCLGLKLKKQIKLESDYPQIQLPVWIWKETSDTAPVSK